MSDRGKVFEREIAEALGGRRIGVSGRATADVVVENPPLLVEVKNRRRMTWGLLCADLEAAERKAAERGDGWCGMAVGRRKLGQGRPSECVVMMGLETLRRLLGLEAKAPSRGPEDA